jgi:hypothetical protein
MAAACMGMAVGIGSSTGRAEGMMIRHGMRGVYGGRGKSGGHGEDTPSQDRARGGVGIGRAAAGGLEPGGGGGGMPCRGAPGLD